MNIPTVTARSRAVTSALRTALRAAGLVRGTTLVVAVSGGPDSLCLLDSMHRAAPSLGLALHVAHLDHGYRGAASAEDAAFVLRTCDALGLRCTIERRSVPEYQANHPEVTSVEAAARTVRYQFLADAVDATGAAAVVTGHTKDDQAETVLLRVIRGTGIDGLAGMRADSTMVTETGTLRVLRPLLGVPRLATHAYCAAAGLTPRDDETNGSPEFTRNRLRMQVLPPLQLLNPRISDALTQLGDQAQRDEDYWANEVERQLGAEPFRDGLLLRRDRLRAAPQALRARVVRSAVITVVPDLELSFDHTQALMHLVHGPTGKELAIQDAGLYAFTTHTYLALLPKRIDLGGSAPALNLPVPGSMVWGGWAIAVREAAAGKAPGTRFSATINPAAASDSMTVRHRHDGDRYGAGKLQDALVNAHCPAMLRDHLPVFEGRDGLIVWAAGTSVPRASRAVVGHGGFEISVQPTAEILRDVLRLWEGRSYNGEAPTSTLLSPDA